MVKYYAQKLLSQKIPDQQAEQNCNQKDTYINKQLLQCHPGLQNAAGNPTSISATMATIGPAIQQSFDQSLVRISSVGFVKRIFTASWTWDHRRHEAILTFMIFISER